MGLLLLGIARASPLGAGGDLPYSVGHWAYQLQGYSAGLEEIAASRFDLVVIDYSRFGDAASEFSREAIDRLRFEGPCGRRLVLGYLSIGEAESFRFYFDPDWLDETGLPVPGVAPEYLGPPNPDFPDNYKVRFWKKSWQRVLFGIQGGPEKSYLDRILDAGFDGVYLDIIDAFEFFGPEEIGGNNERRQAGKDMVTLVRRIARYARKTTGREDFLVVPQNGSNIIDPSTYPDARSPERVAERQRRRYFRRIDGIGAEDTFFFGPRENDNPFDPQEETVVLLHQFLAGDKVVLAIDYLSRPQKIERFYELVSERGYVPYVSRRDLDRLTITVGHEPSCPPP